jgi:hypothetical protein
MKYTRSVRQLLVTANVIPSSLIHVTLIMEALCSSEMSVLIRTAWCNIPEYGILHSHHENLKSYKERGFSVVDDDLATGNNTLILYRYNICGLQKTASKPTTYFVS